MISAASDRKDTSSESCIDSDPNELLPELESTLMAPNEAGLDSRELGPGEWGEGEARGDRCGRPRGTTRYGYTHQPMDICRRTKVIPFCA